MKQHHKLSLSLIFKRVGLLSKRMERMNEGYLQKQNWAGRADPKRDRFVKKPAPSVPGGRKAVAKSLHL